MELNTDDILPVTNTLQTEIPVNFKGRHSSKAPWEVLFLPPLIMLLGNGSAPTSRTLKEKRLFQMNSGHECVLFCHGLPSIAHSL